MSLGKRTGYASLPLHDGKAPAWLFSRMVLLSREILAARIDRTERVNALKRLAKICEARDREASRTIPRVV